MINEARIREYFLDLVQIDSESFDEHAMAQRMREDLKEVGAVEVSEDGAGSKLGSNAGNIIARFKGAVSDAPPLFLCAHMDTVVPGKGVKPHLDGDVVHTDGTTILGADDKSGIAIILEALRVAKEREFRTGDLEVVFTICEEKGLLGASALDLSQLRSKFGLVFDATDPSVLYTKAPAANHFEWRIYGQAAHAAVAPERGISAIQIAAHAIATMRLGRIDEETTANVGIIKGGMATNIIPEMVVVQGEARSRNLDKLAAQTQHMVQCFEEAAAKFRVELETEVHVGRVDAHIEKAYDAMNLSDDSAIVRLAQAAGKNLNVPVPTMAMGGACDANVFNGKGIAVANMGTGMRDIHSTNESIDLRDMNNTGRVVLELLRLHADGVGR